MTKKRSLLLVSLFLVFGLAAMAPTAMAQTTWGAAAANENQFARAQGLAESTGELALSQQNASGTVLSGTEFIVEYTTGTTSTSAPNVSVTSIGTVILACSGDGSSPWTDGSCGNTFGLPYLTDTSSRSPQVPSGPVLHIPFAVTTVFANAAAGNGSTLGITVRLNDYNSPLYPHGGTVQANVTFYNPSTTEYITITPNPSYAGTVQQVNPDPALAVGFGIWCGGRDSEQNGCSNVSNTAYVLLCLGVTDVPTYTKWFTLNIGENFANAMSTESWEDAEDPGTATTVPGVVTNGLILSVVLNNIPANFGVSAIGEGVPCVDVTASSSLYCPGGTLAVVTSGSEHYWNPGPSNTGSYTFEFAVTSEDNGNPNNVNLPFVIYSKGPIGTSALPCITAQVYKQPWGMSTLVTGTGVPAPYYTYSAVPSGIMPIPAFAVVAENAPLNVVCFNNCETNLLFKFVINYGPWDTDLAISNTTLDPLSYLGNNPPTGYTVDPWLVAGSATPQTGACSLFFFSNGYLQAGGAVSTFTTGPIIAGSTWTADLQAQGLIPGVRIGYIWAKCYFSQAYGYAEVLYNYGLNNAMESSYDAIIIPAPQWSPRDQNGDGMGEGSTTPINLERDLQKGLSGLYGHSCCF